MGVIEVAALAVAAVGAIGGIYGQQRAASAQKKASRRAEAERKEATAISQANEQSRMINERRRAVREERVRRARILQSAENTGVSGSSGVASAGSNLSVNLGGVISQSQGTNLASQGISAANQRGADALAAGQRSASQWNMFGNISTALGSLGSRGIQMFETPPPTNLNNVGLFGTGLSFAGPGPRDLSGVRPQFNP
jgi:hypothetical protein